MRNGMAKKLALPKGLPVEVGPTLPEFLGFVGFVGFIKFRQFTGPMGFLERTMQHVECFSIRGNCLFSCFL